ncbi:MAG: protein tyrosine phosphatase family protein [Woeseiaceae bacterium]|nr:protein tyrosine phosphatase family protein [Woeseiaceae bacterium]
MKIADQIATLAVTLAFTGFSNAGELSEISNFRQYSPTFASSGQPTKEQLGMLKDEGFERIIYIAFSNSGKAIAEEDVIVKELGMDYIHVPVIWDKPTAADFYAFAGSMQRDPERKTLLHCQVNYRASAFSFLYRVLYDDVPVAEAKAAMNTVWQPNETWRKLIFEILEDNGKSPHCSSCDWTSTD